MTTPSTTTVTKTTLPPNHDHDENNINNNQKNNNNTSNDTSTTKKNVKITNDIYDFLLDRFRSNVKQSPDKVAVAYLTTTTSQQQQSTSITTTPMIQSPYHVRIERQLTYSQLDIQTNEVAYQLLHHPHCNIQPGDRVMLVYPPSLDFMIAFLACCKINVIAVPVFPPNPNRKDSIRMFHKIVQECTASIALTSKQYNYVKKLISIKETIQKNTKFILFQGKKQSQSQQNSSTTASSEWPDHLQWIVTDDFTSVNTVKDNKKKKSQTTKESTKIQNRLDLVSTYQQSLDQIAFLQFTSGSTSDPKGVMITHGNLAHNLTIITRELQATPNTIVVSWLPQYHDMGLIGSYLGILYCGGTGYYLSPLTFLQNPSIWIEAITLYRGTHLQAPNFAFKLTSRKFDSSKYRRTTPSNNSNNNKEDNSSCRTTTDQTNKIPLDLSCVQHVINAAEPVDEYSIQQFYDTFGPFGFPQGVIYPTYGLAEHTVFVCSGGQQRITVNKQLLEKEGIVQIITTKPDDDNNNNKSTLVSRLVGCGYPTNQNVTVKIVKAKNENVPEQDRVDVDDNDTMFHAVQENMVGEIWIQSPSKAAGYYKKEMESKHDFHAVLNSDDSDDGTKNGNTINGGYLRTGDLGFIHQKELFICGRLKDLIIIGGRNYYPQDIEITAESTLTDTVVRFGCSAAFTINPTPNTDYNSNNDKVNTSSQNSSDGEEVALVMELRDVPKSSSDVNSLCTMLAEKVRSAITVEHSLGLSVIIFLKPRTVPKTSSGKIARSWCRKAFVNKTLQIIYEKSYKTNNNIVPVPSPLEIDQDNEVLATSDIPTTNDGGRTSLPAATGSASFPPLNAEQMRALDREEIIKRLLYDVSLVGNIPFNTIDTKVALVTMMDSITLSQFKGLFERNYYIKSLSDEYLLRDTTSIQKLCEIALLGYAPDDGGVDNNNNNNNNAAVVGNAGGLAGAMGCPPGVVCTIL